MTFLCLHGFLGEASNFSFLEDEFSFESLCLDNYVDLDLKTIQASIEKQFSIKEKVSLLGYSFGARMSIGLFLENPDFYERVILLGGHLGLSSDQERQDREKFEHEMIDLLQNSNRSDFFKHWNSYSLFESDQKISDNGQNLSRAQSYFKNWGLSAQKFYGNELIKYRDRVFWHFGCQDIKYSDYAKKNLKDFDVVYHEGIGHRFLQHPDKVKEILRSVIC